MLAQHSMSARLLLKMCLSDKPEAVVGGQVGSVVVVLGVRGGRVDDLVATEACAYMTVELDYYA